MGAYIGTTVFTDGDLPDAAASSCWRGQLRRHTLTLPMRLRYSYPSARTWAPRARVPRAGVAPRVRSFMLVGAARGHRIRVGAAVG